MPQMLKRARLETPCRCTFVHALDILADATRKPPRCGLTHAAKHQKAPSEPRYNPRLEQHDRQSNNAGIIRALQEQEQQAGDGLSAQENRNGEGIAEELAQRLHFILDGAGHFRWFDLTAPL